MSRAFLFGKLPTHGDFVQRGLDEADRDAWDVRASALLEHSRASLGDAFEEAHDQSPPWRFVCGPSSLGQSWRAGALAPSVDGAGRRFFIILGMQGLSAGEAGAFGVEAAEACEGAIYGALAEGRSADTALAALEDITSSFAGENEPEPEPEQSLWWTVDETGARADEIASAELPADLLVRTYQPVTSVESAP